MGVLSPHKMQLSLIISHCLVAFYSLVSFNCKFSPQHFCSLPSLSPHNSSIFTPNKHLILFSVASLHQKPSFQHLDNTKAVPHSDPISCLPRASSHCLCQKAQLADENSKWRPRLRRVVLCGVTAILHP